MKEGISEGRKPELTGGGLLRSIGGWSVLKGFRETGIRVKGDERILGDHDFVENVLKAVEEGLEQPDFINHPSLKITLCNFGILT
jgi:putative transposase